MTEIIGSISCKYVEPALEQGASIDVVRRVGPLIHKTLYHPEAITELSTNSLYEGISHETFTRIALSSVPYHYVHACLAQAGNAAVFPEFIRRNITPLLRPRMQEYLSKFRIVSIGGLKLGHDTCNGSDAIGYEMHISDVVLSTYDPEYMATGRVRMGKLKAMKCLLDTTTEYFVTRLMDVSSSLLERITAAKRALEEKKAAIKQFNMRRRERDAAKKSLSDMQNAHRIGIATDEQLDKAKTACAMHIALFDAALKEVQSTSLRCSSVIEQDEFDYTCQAASAFPVPRYLSIDSEITKLVVSPCLDETHDRIVRVLESGDSISESALLSLHPSHRARVFAMTMYTALGIHVSEVEKAITEVYLRTLPPLSSLSHASAASEQRRRDAKIASFEYAAKHIKKEKILPCKVNNYCVFKDSSNRTKACANHIAPSDASMQIDIEALSDPVAISAYLTERRYKGDT
jgi:hypothetical protein